MKQFQKLVCKTRDEWRAERRRGIGATDIAAITGISPWATSYDVWRDKRGELPDVDSPAMMAGRLFEDGVARWFELETGQIVVKNSAADFLAISTKNPVLRCSPDRLYRRRQSKELGLLECKTCRKPLDPEALPPQYIAQVQWQMGVTGIHCATLAWCAAGIDFGYAEIRFDPEYYAEMESTALEWWARYMEGGETPPPMTADDCRRQFPAPVESAAVAGESELLACRRLAQVNDEIKGLESEKKKLTDEICAAIGGNSALVISDENGGAATLATFKPQKSSRFDAAAFKSAHPDEYADYVKVSETRVFRLKL